MSDKATYVLCGLLLANLVARVIWYVYDLPFWSCDISLIRYVVHQ